MSNDTTEFTTTNDETDFREKLESFAKGICEMAHLCKNEETTKTALVIPFFNEILNYNTKDPREFWAEYPADHADKNKDKVDYAIFRDGKAIIALECKPCGCDLKDWRGQLRNYFGAVLSIKMGVLTDGIVYEFYADSKDIKVMDEKAFLSFSLRDIAEGKIEDSILEGVKNLQKALFKPENIREEAKRKFIFQSLMEQIKELFQNPNESFVRNLLKNEKVTGKNIKEYIDLTKEAFNKFIDLIVSERLDLPQQTREKEKPIMAEEVSVPDPDKEVPKRTRRTFSSLKDIAEKGKISSDIVIMDKEGRWKAVITQEGKIRTDDGKTWSSLSDLRDVLTDHKYKGSAWDFWYTEYKGQLVSLFDWRADLESVAE